MEPKMSCDNHVATNLTTLNQTLRFEMCLNTNGLDEAICRLILSFMAPINV